MKKKFSWGTQTYRRREHFLLFLFFVCSFFFYKTFVIMKNETNCSHLHLDPVPRRPRPPSSPSTLKHTQRKRSLRLQLFLLPLISIPCPPPRLNSRMHLTQITHPHHNRHPFTLTLTHPYLCLAYRPRHSDARDLRFPNDTHSLLRRIAHSAGSRMPRWRRGRRCEETHTKRRRSDHLRYTRAAAVIIIQCTGECAQRRVL